MLESKAELSLSRSAAVTRKVLPQRGAQHRSRQGEWRPSDIVRATPGRPLPARLAKRKDLRRSKVRGPCHFSARCAFVIAPGRRHDGSGEVCRHVVAAAVPSPQRQREGPADFRTAGHGEKVQESSTAPPNTSSSWLHARSRISETGKG